GWGGLSLLSSAIPALGSSAGTFFRASGRGLFLEGGGKTGNPLTRRSIFYLRAQSPARQLFFARSPLLPSRSPSSPPFRSDGRSSCRSTSRAFISRPSQA